MIQVPRRWATTLLAAVLAVVLGVGAAAVAPPRRAEAQTGPTTLILYDTTGPYAWLGEQYAILTANLVSRFGTWVARPVSEYRAGDMANHRGVIYIGTTYDEPLPAAFLDDVIADRGNVLWAAHNIWQVFDRQFASTGTYFANTRGWQWVGYDTSPVSTVTYKGIGLKRYAANAMGILDLTVTDPAKATVLATATRADGSTLPWATRSGRLTYVGESPYAYMSEGDRYLAWADLLFDLLAPTTPTRRRALVRLEDISPMSDPNELKRVGDLLRAERVPFAFQIIPVYRDPRGVYNGGVPQTVRLRDRPEVVKALKDLIAKGGTPVMHGYTHQYGTGDNPYNGVTGDDFEFYLAYVDVANFVRLIGPPPEDSVTWVLGRLSAGLTEIAAAGLPRPSIFTFPHYAGSVNAYRAVRQVFSYRLDRALYFNGLLTGSAPDYSRPIGQYFPYPVTDVYGQFVLPENLGNEETEEYNNNPPRSPGDIIDAARRNLVVRDGFASFFWHPYNVNDPLSGIDNLRTIIRGIKALGYTFVAPTSITRN